MATIAGTMEVEEGVAHQLQLTIMDTSPMIATTVKNLITVSFLLLLTPNYGKAAAKSKFLLLKTQLCHIKCGKWSPVTLAFKT